jgi:hypothetical protein
VPCLGIRLDVPFPHVEDVRNIAGGDHGLELFEVVGPSRQDLLLDRHAGVRLLERLVDLVPDFDIGLAAGAADEDPQLALFVGRVLGAGMRPLPDRRDHEEEDCNQGRK